MGLYRRIGGENGSNHRFIKKDLPFTMSSLLGKGIALLEGLLVKVGGFLLGDYPTELGLNCGSYFFATFPHNACHQFFDATIGIDDKLESFLGHRERIRK
jgi:hypothetical protein